MEVSDGKSGFRFRPERLDEVANTRRQIHSTNPGYNYKNSITQGGFFNIATRLGAFTNNQTYYDWADKMYDWCESVGLISPSYQVFDGTDVLIKCSELNHNLWYVSLPEEPRLPMMILQSFSRSYNAGIFLHGSAVMWNQVSSQKHPDSHGVN